MSRSPESSDAAFERAIALLTACHHRGPLTLAELHALLLPTESGLDDAAEALASAGLLERRGDRYAATATGRRELDRILEAIEAKIAPDDPDYVRRHRCEEPSLPFAADAIWAEAICANVRVSPNVLRPHIPLVFELDLHGSFAFVSLTASRLKDFGAGPLPRMARTNFYQSTFRAHVTFTDFRGRKMRGCYFVRSDTSSALMSLAANLLPEFRDHRCGTLPMVMARDDAHLVFTVDSPDDPAGRTVLVLDLDAAKAEMPKGSAFATLSEACALLVDFYDAFAYDPRTDEVLILGIERGPWNVAVVPAIDAYFGYFAAGPFPAGSFALDCVFYFRDVPYRWLPLLKERCRR